MVFKRNISTNASGEKYEPGISLFERYGRSRAERRDRVGVFGGLVCFCASGKCSMYVLKWPGAAAEVQNRTLVSVRILIVGYRHRGEKHGYGIYTRYIGGVPLMGGALGARFESEPLAVELSLFDRYGWRAISPRNAKPTARRNLRRNTNRKQQRDSPDSCVRW